MKQAEYLSTVLGPKYKLTTFEVDTMAAALAEIYRTGFRMKLDGAPLLWDFDTFTDDEIYEVVRQGINYWGLLSRLGHTADPVGVFHTLRMFMTKGDAPSDLRKVAMVLLTEWSEGVVLEERSRQIAPQESDEAPVRKRLSDLAMGMEVEHEGWLATGKYPLQVPNENGVGSETTIIDLDQPFDEEKLPAALSIARLMRAAWNAEKGIVEPMRVEAMVELLAGLFHAERVMFEQKINEAQSSRSEASSLWPKHEGHWIFDQQVSVLQPGLKMAHDHPNRMEVEAAVNRAARFAVSRASGMGTSRIFNIEGFVHNVALGLLGDGQDGENFDIGEMFGRSEVHLPCTRQHVDDVGTTLPQVGDQLNAVAQEANAPARKPRTRKPAVQPTAK